MRATVRHEMTEAVVAYEEKPREQWLFDYPAQVCTSTLKQILDIYRKNFNKNMGMSDYLY